MTLSKLLNPKVIALVGASENDGFGGDTARNLLENSFNKEIYFINPKRTMVFGNKCYKDISEIPNNIDQVIIAANKKLVINILEKSAKKGAKSAIVFSSGYNEIGSNEGLYFEKELKKTATRLNMLIMGPNCAGFANFISNTCCFGLKIPQKNYRGKIALLAQSGQVCLSAMESQNMKMSYNISVGNGTVVKIEDYLKYLISDINTNVIAVHLEGINNPQLLVDCFKLAAAKKKPIVLLKIGRSKKGSMSAASHTGSLASSDRVVNAICEKFGIIRVDDMQELFTVSSLLSTISKYPSKENFGFMSISGGEVGISADSAEDYQIHFPDFNGVTVSKLSSLLPDFATVNNPLDTTASVAFNADIYAKVIQAILNDNNIEGLIIGYSLPNEINDPVIHYMYEGIVNVVSKENIDKPIMLMSFVEHSHHQEYQEKLLKIGVPILPPPKYAFSALKKVISFGKYDNTKREQSVALSENNLNMSKQMLNEVEGMAILSENGIAIPKTKLVHNSDEAIAFSNEIDGKVALKIASKDIQHKSDVGGVLLNLEGEKSVKEGFEKIINNVQEIKGEIDGITIQEMLPEGLECIVGVTYDQQFGFMGMIGLGGVYVDLLDDNVIYPIPFNEFEAYEMVKKLKAWPVFSGFRGSKPLDIENLVKSLVAISKYAVENKNSLLELDINPLFIYDEGKGVCAADALIIKRKASFL